MSEIRRTKGAALASRKLTPEPRSTRALSRSGASDSSWTNVLRSVPAELFFGINPVGLDRKRDVIEQMVQALGLTGSERVLEIGTGTGYRSALLARLAREVYSLERRQDVAEAARARHLRLGLSNVHVVEADGSKGFALRGPYQAILVSGALPYVPTELIDQLDEGGRLVIPIGDDEGQLVERVRKLPQALETDTLTWCSLSPIVCENAPRTSRRPWMRSASGRSSSDSQR